MNSEVVPAINNNIAAIKAFPAQIARAKNDIINTMQKEITNFVNKNVMPPLIAFKNTLESVGAGIKQDITTATQQGINMTNTIKNEMVTIRNRFASFGNNIKTQAYNVATTVKAVGDELVEAVNEVKPALGASVSWAKEAAKRASRLNVLGAAIAAYKSIEYLVFRGYNGQNAVIPELMEGFQEISAAFLGLKNNFVSFGETLKTQSVSIGDQVSTSSTNIKNSADAFLTTLKGSFDNMASRIKSGTGQVVNGQVVNGQVENGQVETNNIPLNLLENTNQDVVHLPNKPPSDLRP